MVDCVLWLGNDGALIDFPIDQHALDTGLKPSGEFLPCLPCVTQIVAFRHLGFIYVSKERCKSLDIVGGLLEQLGNGDGVMKASGESQQH